MDPQPGVIPFDNEFKLLNDAYGFSLIDGLEFLAFDSMVLSPPTGKFGIYLKTFDTDLCLLLTDFQEEILKKNNYIIQMLNLNVVNKMVAFDMICRANGMLPDSFVFKFFFFFSATGDMYTFSAWHGGHILVLDNKTPKNWQYKWLWVNQDQVGHGH